MDKCEAGNNIHRLHPCEVCGAESNEECRNRIGPDDWALMLAQYLSELPPYNWDLREEIEPRVADIIEFPKKDNPDEHG